LTPLTSYHKKLFVFLSLASFFEGYDFTALGQILPNLRAEMGMSEAAGGQLVAVVSAGTLLSYIFVRLADRFGRRPILAITILGYATFTFLTAFSRTPYDFAFYQIAARVFLVAEWALAMVYAAEEFPADRRGFVIGVIQASTLLGSVVCAAVAPLLLSTALGWRSVYLIGVIPMLLLAYARRALKETKRYLEQAGPRGMPTRSFTAIFQTKHGRRVFQVALVWALTYVCTQSAVIFWKEFAVNERGMTDADVGIAVALASVAALPFIFLVGKMVDEIGRRKSSMVIYSICIVFVVAAFQLSNFWLLTLCLTAALFAAVGLLTVLNAFTTELFPTEWRADAFAWSNNLLGRIGYVVGPLIVGYTAGYLGWGNAVSLTVVFLIAALGLILWLFPETSGLELEEAAVAVLED
jgi:putative MFS transporter